MKRATYYSVVALFLGACSPLDIDVTMQANTQQCPAQVLEGVDVYNGYGAIDWVKVAASGRRFAFIKATQGDYNKQGTFNANWANSRAAGVVRCVLAPRTAEAHGFPALQGFRIGVVGDFPIVEGILHDADLHLGSIPGVPLGEGHFHRRRVIHLFPQDRFAGKYGTGRRSGEREGNKRAFGEARVPPHLQRIISRRD